MNWINGKADSRIEVSDRGLQYGDGLFETILVHDARAHLWPQHLDRLTTDAARLGIPVDARRIESEAFRFLDELASDPHRDSDGILKLIVTRGSGGRGYRPPASPVPARILQWHPLPADLAGQRRNGIAVTACQHPVSINPALAGIKHLNRLDQVMASRELGAEWDEGVMCDTDGRLVEGTRSNVFLVDKGCLRTPSLTRCGVAGVMRGEILRLATRQGIEVELIDTGLDGLLVADEIFVCNSIAGILPVRNLAVLQQSRELSPGPVTRNIQHWLNEELPPS